MGVFLLTISTEDLLHDRVARSPAPHYPQNHLGPGSLAPNFGDHGPSDSALAACSARRLRRPGAERHAARCASRDLCSGGAPRRYSPSIGVKLVLLSIA